MKFECERLFWFVVPTPSKELFYTRWSQATVTTLKLRTEGSRVRKFFHQWWMPHNVLYDTSEAEGVKKRLAMKDRTVPPSLGAAPPKEIKVARKHLRHRTRLNRRC